MSTSAMTTTDRLLVSRQDPVTRRYHRVGELQRADGEFVFTYDRGVTRALPGLPLAREHRSSDMFPVFAERVMSPLRSDHRDLLGSLGLEGDSEPFEVLAVSGGRRVGDSVEVTPLPAPGPARIPFLVHGIRHRSQFERAHIDGLVPGSVLALEPEPHNPISSRALIVSHDGVVLGYVPDPLLHVVHDVMTHPHRLTVVRVNPREAGYHLRLLVALEGTVSDAA